MRIWDINPGYLNDKSLLGEHVELHGLVSIVANHKKGYSNHPETKRWNQFMGAINKRHSLLISELEIRGFNHNSPLKINDNENIWPKVYIDSPFRQFEILFQKYENKDMGRIPLPISAQHIWRQHKFSIMARNIKAYKEIGVSVSKMKPKDSFEDLSKELVELLRLKPETGGIRNALQHMWGYFKNYKVLDVNVNSLGLNELLLIIQKLAYEKKMKYILESTALSDLKIWM